MTNLEFLNVGNLKNQPVTFLVDDLNNDNSLGYTNSREKIIFNIHLLGKLIANENLEERLARSKKGLTFLFPLERYIVYLKLKKDLQKMEMIFFDFRVDYSAVDKGFEDIFSDKFVTEFKRIKYYREEEYDPATDKVVLSLG